MKLLAWDTSSTAGALAAIEWEPRSPAGRDGIRLVSEWSLDVAATHSERLLWSIHSILEASRWKLEDVDVFAVGVGPGSFTGLRIGVTTARSLAHTLAKPLIGVSSLAALSRPAAIYLEQQKERAVVVATTDACKGELFSLLGSARSVMDCVCTAEGDLQGLWKRGVEEAVLTPDALTAAIKKKIGVSVRDKDRKTLAWMAIGEGRKRYPEAWAALSKTREIRPAYPFADRIQGRYVAILAWEAYQAGLARDPLLVHPKYLRASDAELKLRAGLLPPQGTEGRE
jgi:tRNA threonylcarbamoyl adenosine modification protein YeaZ